MQLQFEKSLQHDIDHIRNKVSEMGRLAENALESCLKLIIEKDFQLAYSIILRDRYIDELEKELDQLCQEFLIRQLPAGGHLRFVYAVTKINMELERIGDYAESIARQFLKINSIEPQPPYQTLVDLANHSIPMLRNAIQSFIDEDVELAKMTMKIETKVDSIRHTIHKELMQLQDKEKLPLEAILPLITISNRFERVADQACNICQEVLFMCTGEDIKHVGKEIIRILFVDENDSCRTQMAKGIGVSLKLHKFYFNSAGISPQSIDKNTIHFMLKKGIDITKSTPKYLNQIPKLYNYQVIISLCKEGEVAFPTPPTKQISISWMIENPSTAKGSKTEIEASYEKTFQFLNTHIRDLTQAILGDNITRKEKG